MSWSLISNDTALLRRTENSNCSFYAFSAHPVGNNRGKVLLPPSEWSNYFIDARFPGVTAVKGQVYNFGPTQEHYEFIWNSPDNQYLARMRQEYRLEEMVAGSAGDLERIRIIAAWVSNLWKHHGFNSPAKYDPLFMSRWTVFWKQNTQNEVG